MACHLDFDASFTPSPFPPLFLPGSPTWPGEGRQA